MNKTELQKIDQEYARVAGLLETAERRMGESWDKPEGVQRRNRQTVAKHRAALARLEARAAELEAEAC